MCPGSIAIVLYGGFGRNEGSWYQDDRGTWRPYNDIDTCIITHKKADESRVRDLENRLAREVGIRWVDISQFHPSELTKLRPSIQNYDYRYASRVIDGNPDVLRRMPEMDARHLPIKEVQTLYFTRLYTLLGSLDESGIDQDIEDEPSRFFRNQMAKAVLAVVDVLLLRKNAYHHSYKTRVDRVGELYSQKPTLIELSQWALQEKLFPKAISMSSKEVRQLYGSVHSLFLDEMYRGLEYRFARSVTCPQDIEYCMKRHPVSCVKRLCRLIKHRNLQPERKLAIMLAQSYIAAAWTPSAINEPVLNRGVELLGRVDGSLGTGLTWNQARVEVARLRMEV